MASSFDGISTFEQLLSKVPLIPEALGDETKFRASLNLAPIWKGSMTRCKRSISSPNLEAGPSKMKAKANAKAAWCFSCKAVTHSPAASMSGPRAKYARNFTAPERYWQPGTGMRPAAG
jgi:hypothetical protein